MTCKYKIMFVLATFAALAALLCSPVKYDNEYDPKSSNYKPPVTVINGKADKEKYPIGATVTITADPPPAGHVFSHWTSDSSDINFADSAREVTTFILPARPVTVTGVFVDTTTPPPPPPCTTGVNCDADVISCQTDLGCGLMQRAACKNVIGTPVEDCPKAPTCTQGTDCDSDSTVCVVGNVCMKTIRLICKNLGSEIIESCPTTCTQGVDCEGDVGSCVIGGGCNNDYTRSDCATAGGTFTIGACPSDPNPDPDPWDGRWCLIDNACVAADRSKWEAGSCTYTSQESCDADIVLPPTTYTITFDLNYEGCPQPTSGTTGVDGKLASLPVPERDGGYRFDGWFTAITGGEKVTISKVFDEDATIYAQWTLATLKLTTNTIDDNKGTVTREPDFGLYGDGEVVKLIANAKDGYVFTHWTAGEKDSHTLSAKDTITITMFSDSTLTAHFIQGFSFIDTRDGQKYRAVTIGGQTWMAENLNYAGEVGGNTVGVCQGNSEDNCAKYGRLYTWVEAMNVGKEYETTLWNGSDVKHQGACPAGWHLPDTTEWAVLKTFAGGYEALRSTSGWKDDDGNDANGTDIYGFSALPGGFYGTGSNVGTKGYWWSATNTTARDASYLRIDTGTTLLAYSKNTAFSVRCVRDDD